MRTLTITPNPRRTNSPPPPVAGRGRFALARHAAAQLKHMRGVSDGGFAPLIDAKAASRLLGVPHTWLLAQARAGRIPHHRLGHYVRFNADDLDRWLKDTRRGPSPRLDNAGGLGR
jgi:excisionase family DNA binding protein